MNTPPLPPNHELLPPDFLRKHGAVKGLLCRGTNADACQWTEYARMATVPLSVFIESGCVFSAPLGTIAAATTPVPEGRCDCGGEEEAHGMGQVLSIAKHSTDCPAHPRNAYVHILPHLLAQLPEKPEGLMWACAGSPDDWEPFDEPLYTAFGSEHDFKKQCMAFAYAVPRHVMDRIEQQQKSVPPPPECFGGEQALAKCQDTGWVDTRPAAPERSQPSQEAAPSDTEMLDWASQFFSFDGCGETCIAMMNEKFLAKLRVPKGSEEPTLRKAIAAAMKEDRK